MSGGPHQQPNLARAVDVAAEKEAARQAREAIIEIQAAAYDRAAAYTNLILLGGYAGAFAIWAYTLDQLTPKATILIALLLTISLTAFIFFEVYKMVLATRAVLKQTKLLAEDLPPKAFLQRLEALKREHDGSTVTTLMRVWIVIMAISVGTALAAVAIIFYNFFSILLGYPGWPAG